MYTGVGAVGVARWWRRRRCGRGPTHPAKQSQLAADPLHTMETILTQNTLLLVRGCPSIAHTFGTTPKAPTCTTNGTPRHAHDYTRLRIVTHDYMIAPQPNGTHLHEQPRAQPRAQPASGVRAREAPGQQADGAAVWKQHACVAVLWCRGVAVSRVTHEGSCIASSGTRRRWWGSACRRPGGAPTGSAATGDRRQAGTRQQKCGDVSAAHTSERPQPTYLLPYLPTSLPPAAAAAAGCACPTHLDGDGAERQRDEHADVGLGTRTTSRNKHPAVAPTHCERVRRGLHARLRTSWPVCAGAVPGRACARA